MPAKPGEASRFKLLDGAVIAARAIGDWALRSGFGAGNVQIVTDEWNGNKPQPVTRERVQQAVDSLFPAQAEVVEHLILSFCGHGLTAENIGSIYWLFSDSVRNKYRVAGNEFYAELQLHGVERITLISDACREAPKDLDLMRLEPTRGVTVHGTKVDSPKFDRLAACQDGQLGFMVSDPNAAGPGKCLFSGVITDILWGQESEAIKGGVITTTDLGRTVRSRTTARAKDYRLKLNPECMVDPEPAMLYSTANPPQGDPGLQPWPAPGAPVLMGPATNPAVAEPRTPDENFELARSDKAFRSRILGAGFGATRFAAALPSDFVALPEESKDLLHELVRLRESSSGPALESLGGQDSDLIESTVGRLEADATAYARKVLVREAHRSLVQMRSKTSDDLIVADLGAAIWARGSIETSSRTNRRLGFRVAGNPPGTPTIVEFADGTMMPVVLYESLCLLVTRDAAGVVLPAYEEQRYRDTFKHALQVAADFAAGRLSVDRVDELAAHLRYRKHADPVLGVIAAYLYRAAADFDSIRRMAYFYADAGQPVPYDVALLGEMAVSRGPQRELRLHVPEVGARRPGQRTDKLPRFVVQATPAIEASIGGLCPWLALGWDYVSMARPEQAELIAGLREFAGELPRSGFTVLSADIGRALAREWKLERRQESA